MSVAQHASFLPDMHVLLVILLLHLIVLVIPVYDSYRDDDQGLHLRLAQSCSLDSGKACYPQRHGPSKEGLQVAEHSRCGSYGSSDGTPVGDVDYHRPHGHHGPAGSFHSSGSNSYYARKQGPPHRGPGPYDRPAQYRYEPTGAYSRGPVSPPSMPLAGGPPGAGPMGPPVHSGSVRGSFGPGLGYGHPRQHTYGPPGSYGMPPQHSYGAPGAYAAPPDAAAVPRPPPREPVGVPGPMGSYEGAPSYGPPTGMYGAPPPPPPPPRQLPPQQAPVERAPAAYMSDRTVTRPESVQPAVVHMEANVPPLAAPPLPRPVATAQPDRPAAAAMQPAASTAAPAVAGKTTPFAAPEPEPAAEAPAAPKNEFAERLAQRAMASAARAKSSLLAGGGSGALSSADSLGRHDSLASSVGKPPVRGMSIDIPATAASGPDSGGSSPTDPSGVFVKPSHPFGRPKLALKPRSVPMDAAVSASGNYSSTSSDSGDAPAEHGSGSTAGSVASSVGGGRPRLNLLPRGSSLPDSSAGASATAGARKPSVFGDAKPREEVLKQRGLDPALVDAAVEIGRAHADAPAARQGSMGDRVSRRSEEDEWHQVSAHGRKGSAAHRDVRTLPEDAFDPFFGNNGSAKITSHSEYVSVPPARASSRDYMREGYGGSRHHGSPGNRASGYAVDAEEDDGAGVFRRALPTRQVPLAL